MTGQLYVGNRKKRRDFGIEMVTSRLSNVDQHKFDYDEVPKLMSLEQKEEVRLFPLYK